MPARGKAESAASLAEELETRAKVGQLIFTSGVEQSGPALGSPSSAELVPQTPGLQPSLILSIAFLLRPDIRSVCYECFRQ